MVFFQCVACFLKYPNEDNLLQHIRNKHESLCSICGKTEEDFRGRGAFLEHLKIHNEDNFECDLCTKVFLSQRRLNAHKSSQNYKETIRKLEKIG